MLRAAVAAAASLWVAGCASDRRPNVVLFTFDTTRADHLSTYGYQKNTTPNLSRMAEKGTVFEDCLSAVPITFPSHTSMLTGMFPTRHGGRDNGGYYLGAEKTTLAERLQAEGYSTAAFVSGFPLDSRYNLDQGFERYDDEFDAELTEMELRRRELNTLQITQRRADITTRRALEWLRTAHQPFFVWIHYYDPHASYDPPPPYDQLFFSQPYDGEIAFADQNLGRVWDFAAQAGWQGRTLWVMTADHGESLGDHGEQTHATLTYQPTLHVPLVMRLPRAWGLPDRLGGPKREGASPVQGAKGSRGRGVEGSRGKGGEGPSSPSPTAATAGHRISAPVRTVDIFPTVLDLLGLEIPSEIQGGSLMPLLRGQSDRRVRAAYFECLLPYLHFGWSPLSGVREGRWKFIEAPLPELYDLQGDPDEVTNVAARHRSLVERLAAEVRSFQADPATASRTQQDQEAHAKLIALGYAGATAAGDLGKALSDISPYPNPVEHMAVMDHYNLARQLFAQDDFEASLEASRQALEIDPNNRELLWFSARCRYRLGDSAAAQKDAQRALAIDPQDLRILGLLANLAFERDDLRSTLHYLDRWLTADPTELSAYHLRGICLARLGDFGTAEQAYRKALEIDPSHVDSRVNLAGVLVEESRARSARAELRRALREAPYSARAHYNLGNLELSQGRAEAARREFVRALELSSNYPVARLGLALALESLGRKGEAIKIVKTLVSSEDTDIAARAATLVNQWNEGKREAGKS